MPYHSDPWYRNGSYRYLTVASATSLIQVAFCGLLISQSGSVSTYKHMVLTREITFVDVSRISDMTSPCPSVQAVPAWPRAPTHDNNQALYIFTVAILHPVCPDIALNPFARTPITGQANHSAGIYFGSENYAISSVF